MLEKVGESNIRKKYIYYHCTECDSIQWMREDHFRNGIGCSICNNKTVRAGYNDLATTRPDLMKYLKHKYDAIFNTTTSHVTVDLVCPICGYETNRRLPDLTKRGFNCPVCYGGKSFPSRFMAAILHSLSIQFETEKTFSWAKRYRFDFYIESLNIIIEVNGSQHYRERVGWTPIEIIQRSDKEKKQLALENGITNYFIIDAKRSDVDEMKTNIKNSNMLEIMDVRFDEIDWVKVMELANKNIAVAVLNQWNSGVHNVSEIAKDNYLSEITVRKYLKTYAEKGLCDYDPKKSILECQKLAAKARERPVICTTTNKYFPSIKKAQLYYNLSNGAIYNCLSGRAKSAGKDAYGNKLYWKYA